MSVYSKMTALANEVRELSGSTEALSIDAMTTNVSEANDEVNTQVDLIAQLKSTADALPEATSGGSIDTFNFTLNGDVVFALVNNCWVFQGESTLLPYIIGSENTPTPSMSGYSITILLAAFASVGTDISITVNGVTLDNSNLEITILNSTSNSGTACLSIINNSVPWYNAGDEVIVTLPI